MLQRLRLRLRLRHGRAHRLGAFLEFPPDAVRLHGLFMPVPGEALDPDHGEVAAEAAEALDQRDGRTATRCSQRCREAAKPKSKFALLPARTEIITTEHVRQLMDQEGV